MESNSDETKEGKIHKVRVRLDDHDFECLAAEAKENHRVPSKELEHYVSRRYEKKRPG